MVAAPKMEKRARCFSFANCQYEPASGVANLVYEVDGERLQETITFPWAPWPVDASRQAAFSKALHLLHLVAGISYYKAGLALRIEAAVDETFAHFLDELYEQGLAEFAYVNDLDLSGVISFPGGRHRIPAPVEVDLPERALVAMGGGKDSLVCLRLLQSADIEVQPVCVGGSELIGETVKTAGLPLIRIERKLAGGLLEMNAAGAWNGHVPVTAINSAILLAASLLYGYRYIVFANESSADEATLTNTQGREVNHQYSKSLGFEKSFRELVRNTVSGSVEYFSLLRPFSEAAITCRFAQMTEFHPVFSSCNRNFHQDGSHIEGRWCRDCPKCRFTALALAPFMDPVQLLSIQGADLLDDERQLPGFEDLCGVGKHKPFECVGSISECRALVKFLSGQDDWRDKFIVAALAEQEEIDQAGGLELEPDTGAEHCIPASIMDKINAF
ncbi:MAG: endonuclease domain-containing protein [Xanthomonadales bacterium]|nr:endonuclease domain-containing protein [Xanthomonadales bacterium]